MAGMAAIGTSPIGTRERMFVGGRARVAPPDRVRWERAAGSPFTALAELGIKGN
jgi:hypothetical protein